MLRNLLLASLLFLPSFLPTTLASAAPVGATGPDAHGAWSLAFDVTRAAAGPARLALDVARDNGTDVATGARDLGTMDLPAGISRVQPSFMATEGAGDYRVRLVVDGEPSDALAFHADEASGASRRVAFTVPDAPTYLNLTSDSVNADGKLKNPGDTLVTRATLSDANGLADIDAVGFTVLRAGAIVESGVVTVPLAANATSVSFEHDYARSPLASGSYQLRLAATRAASELAAATRTFVIRESPTLFAGGNLSDVTPDSDAAQTVDVQLADRNGAPDAGVLDARVLRGSAQQAGFNATLGAARRLADLDGAGRTAIPLTLSWPANATAGAYRVSLYLNGSLLGSVPFSVLPLPTLAWANASTEGEHLRIDVSGANAGIIVAQLDDGAGAATATSVAFNGSATVRLDAPSAAPTMRWTVQLLARPGGAPLALRDGMWAPPRATLVVAPERAGARLPATMRASADGYDLAGAQANVTFARWDGTTEPRLTGVWRDGALVVRGPPDLAPGRYAGTLRLTLPNGTQMTGAWTFEAGPWMRLALDAPIVTDSLAQLNLTNEGGVAVKRVVVEADGLDVSLVLNGANATGHDLPNGRRAFDVTLAPGAAATLVARLPAGPQRAGAREAWIRVLGLPEAA